MTDPKPLTPEPYTDEELAAVRDMTLDAFQARLLATLTSLRAKLASVEGERDRARDNAGHAAHEMAVTWQKLDAAESALATVTAERERLRGALEPFATFADKWDAHPISGLHDDLYTIHGGEIEGVLRLSDCKAARAALAACEGTTKGEGA